MSKIKVSKQGNYFERDGKPFFLMSDTDWMAFQKLSVGEWEQLVSQRRNQGFNALQISVLPISHDNAANENDIHPFEMVDGKYLFDRMNKAYFEKAVAMLDIMKKYGMTPFLHLFWCNYIPDTWASQSNPGNVIPFGYIKPLTNYFIDLFDKYDPVYSVSGDTDFKTDQVVKYYLQIFDTLYSRVPDSLTTMHLATVTDPPEVLRKHPQYHFYAYQSGHGIEDDEANSGQTNMLKWSAQYLAKAEKKPIVDTEPCYEGHGYACHYGRFKAKDIRHATWLSLLSGASAGITYGAHGVWQFYRRGDSFNGIGFSGQPYDWHTALDFPGAWDVGFAKWLFERYEMFGISPNKDIEARGDTLRMAEKDRLLVIFAPHPDKFTLLRDLSGYTVEAVALESKRVFLPIYDIEDGKTVFDMPCLNEDAVIIARKN